MTSDENADETYPSAMVRYMEAEREREEAKYAKLALSDAYPGLLDSAYALYSKEHTFEPGQFVQWKPGMRNRVFPTDAVPVVVVRLLDPPQQVDSDGDPLAEPLDLVVGLLDGDRVFRVTTLSSQRVMPFSA